MEILEALLQAYLLKQQKGPQTTNRILPMIGPTIDDAGTIQESMDWWSTPSKFGSPELNNVDTANSVKAIPSTVSQTRTVQLASNTTNQKYVFWSLSRSSLASHMHTLGQLAHHGQ